LAHESASCPHGAVCVHCHPDLPRTNPDSVLVGKVTPALAPALIAQQAWRAAPPDTFELLMAQLLKRKGKKGRHVLRVDVVLDGEEWTETHFPQPPVITRRRRPPKHS
jgi:hypothetical protein